MAKVLTLPLDKRRRRETYVRLRRGASGLESAARKLLARLPANTSAPERLALADLIEDLERAQEAATLGYRAAGLPPPKPAPPTSEPNETNTPPRPPPRRTLGHPRGPTRKPTPP